MTDPMVLSGTAFAVFLVGLTTRAVVSETGAGAPYPSRGRTRVLRLLDTVLVVVAVLLLVALVVLVVSSLNAA